METAIHIGNKVDEAAAKEFTALVLAILNTPAGDAVKIEALRATRSILPPIEGVHIEGCTIDGSTNYLGADENEQE